MPKPAIPTQDTEVIVVVLVDEGIASAVQLVPFHRELHAASVEPLLTFPTAMQYVGVVHDTAPTNRPLPPRGWATWSAPRSETVLAFST